MRYLQRMDAAAPSLRGLAEMTMTEGVLRYLAEEG